MRVSQPFWRYFPAWLLIGFYTITLVQGVPTHTFSLEPREDGDGDDAPDERLPARFQPVKKSDHLPTGDITKASQEYDSDIHPPGYQDNPDYDPNQDNTIDKQRRDVQDVAPNAERKGTQVLRSVGADVPAGESTFIGPLTCSHVRK